MNLIATQQDTATFPRRRAFTLIELLVVISVIALLATFSIVGFNSVSTVRKVNTASAELKEVQLAIENYHAKYGVYPPGNGANTDAAGLTNQLYYELTGVSLATNGGVVGYQTINAANFISQATFTSIFNAGGVLNCTKGSGEDALPSENFLVGLRPNRIGTVTSGAGVFNLLVTSVGGSDDAYVPVGAKGVNPFRYKGPSSTNNNPDSYDLWIDLSLGATNYGGYSKNMNLRLISNWGKAVLKNSLMP